jgi:pSer/pThr/pTyr-binding forkhead associated (FHA) protein
MARVSASPVPATKSVIVSSWGMAYLVLDPDLAGERRIELHGERATIGRAPDNDVCVQHDSLSRAHAAIEVVAGKAYLSDLGSKNGTTLREAPVTRSELQEGDTFRCGDVLFRFALGARVASASLGPSAEERLDALKRAVSFVPALADGEVSIDVLAAIGFDVLGVNTLVFVLFDPVSGAAEERASRAKDASLHALAPRADILEHMQKAATPIRGGADARAWACVPVRRRGTIVGALYIDGAPVDDASLGLLECLASISSIAIFR